MSKCDEIIERIKAKAELQTKTPTQLDPILSPDDLNLRNINEKNIETLEKLSQISRENENNLEK